MVCNLHWKSLPRLDPNSSCVLSVLYLTMPMLTEALLRNRLKDLGYPQWQEISFTTRDTLPLATLTSPQRSGINPSLPLNTNRVNFLYWVLDRCCPSLIIWVRRENYGLMSEDETIRYTIMQWYNWIFSFALELLGFRKHEIHTILNVSDICVVHHTQRCDA